MFVNAVRSGSYLFDTWASRVSVRTFERLRSSNATARTEAATPTTPAASESTPESTPPTAAATAPRTLGYGARGQAVSSRAGNALDLYA